MCLFNSSVFLSAVESGVFSTAVDTGVFSPAVDAGVFSLVVDADMSSLANVEGRGSATAKQVFLEYKRNEDDLFTSTCNQIYIMKI